MTKGHTHLTKGQMVAGSAVHEDLASQASAPTTTGFSVNRLRNQIKEASCRQAAGGRGR